VSTLFVCINAINNTCILFRDLRNGHFFFFYCQSPSHRHTHTHGPFTWRKKRKKEGEKTLRIHVQSLLPHEFGHF
jgi:hypothetical protein